MMNYNPRNERIKRDYFQFLREARGRNEKTIDNVRKAIDRFEKFSNYEDFQKFNKHKATAFKKDLAAKKNKQSGKPLSKSTTVSTFRNLKSFFLWLRLQKGYKRLDVNQIEYLNPNEADIAVAGSRKIKDYPTIEQIKAVLASMPTNTDIEKRNQALIAFTLLTGARDSAIASLKLKHVDIDRGLVEQLPDEVRTKFSKAIHTFFFPVGDEIKQIVIDWIKYLREEKLFGDNDPVFPKTKMTHDDNFELKPDGLEPEHWKSASQIRKTFKEAFESAGMKHYTPHSFRSTLTILGQRKCKTPEDFKAWSQNFGHENPLTTFTSYGHVEEHRQGEIISGLNTTEDNISEKEMLRVLYQKAIDKKSD